MLARIIRILLGLSALWWSQSLLVTAHQLRDEATGGNDIGITQGPLPAASRFEEKNEWNPEFLKGLVNGDFEDDEKLKNMPEPFIRTKRERKPGDIFDEINEQDAQARQRREQEAKTRRQPQKGDHEFFGEDPAVFAKRPENVAKLAEAKDTRQWSEAARYLGYLLILSGVLPVLRELVFGRKPDQVLDAPQAAEADLAPDAPGTPTAAPDSPTASEPEPKEAAREEPKPSA